MTPRTPFERDAATVRALLHQHLPSARSAPVDRATLTVGEVACQLRADRAIPPGDGEAALALLALDVPLPPSLRVSDLVYLTPGVRLSPSFWRAFRDTAVLMGLGRAR